MWMMEEKGGFRDAGGRGKVAVHPAAVGPGNFWCKWHSGTVTEIEGGV